MVISFPVTCVEVEKKDFKFFKWNLLPSEGKIFL